MTNDAKGAAAGKGGAASETVEIVKTVVYALLIALVLRVFLFQPYTIPSASMEPNLYQGDYIIVSKYSYGWSRYSMPFGPPLFNGRLFFHTPGRGDVVVFKLPRQPSIDYIKRLIGLPGDRIQVKSGQVFINDQPVPHNQTTPGVGEINGSDQPVQRFWETLPNGRRFLTNSYAPDGSAENTGVYVVPPHCYFMMGDNRDNSLDSRFDPAMPPSLTGPETCAWDSSIDIPGSEAGVGFVPEEDLVGRAQLILLSWKPNVSLFKPWTWFEVRADRFFRSLR